MSKSYNTVCKLNINAIKTNKKVSGIQFSEVFKAKSTQYTGGSFKSWSDSEWQRELLPSLQTQTVHLHIYFTQPAL